MAPKFDADEFIRQFRFDAAYPLYLQKVERKGHTEEELLKVLKWLTGFTKAQIKKHVKQGRPAECL